MSNRDYLLLIYTCMCIILFLMIIILSFQSHQIRMLSAGLGMAWNRYGLSCIVTLQTLRFITHDQESEQKIHLSNIISPFKVTGQPKKTCMISPISTRLFWFITCIFKRPSLRLFRFKIDKFVPFCIKSTRLINLNLNNRRLGRLQVVINKKKSCTDGGNPTKKCNF